MGKHGGPDDIMAEVIRCCDLDDIMLDFYNSTYVQQMKPSQWFLLNLVPISKTGNTADTNNYRGTSLMCVITKVYNKMLLN